MGSTVGKIGAFALTALLAACANGTSDEGSPTAGTPTDGTPTEGGAPTQTAEEIAYPERAITMIFPFAAGSPGDLNARALAAEAEPILGVSIQVVNREGAAGTIGATEVIQSEPDGYTLGFVPIAPMTIQPQRTDLPYGGPDDYEPVMGATLIAEALSVRADSPWQTLDDFLAAAEADTLTVAVTGQGTILDIDAKVLALESGANLETVSFDGEQQALGAMVGETTDAAVTGIAVVGPFVESGDARVLGVFAEERAPTLPDVPTMPELGYDITFGVDNFIIAPKGTDEAIIDKLHDAFRQAWETEEYQNFLEEFGFIPQYKSPEELRDFLSETYERYGEVVEELGL